MSNKSPIQMRHQRIRKKVSGTPSRPRLAVHFSGQHIYAQVIDDAAGRTVASVSTTEGEFRAAGAVRPNIQTAIRVGNLVAARAVGQNVTTVVFDRGGFIYHGKVKALADAARQNGLIF